MMPEFHERVWGTRDLAPIYTRIVGKEPIGEVWLTGDECKVANGPLSGVTLGELCKRYRPPSGRSNRTAADRFPLAGQVPVSERKALCPGASRRRGCTGDGPAEWQDRVLVRGTVNSGRNGGFGSQAGNDTRAVREARSKKSAPNSLMNWIDVRTGDMIYVDAGTVHAIAPGSILIEDATEFRHYLSAVRLWAPSRTAYRAGNGAMRATTAAGKVIRETRNGHDVSLLRRALLSRDMRLLSQELRR